MQRSQDSAMAYLTAHRIAHSLVVCRHKLLYAGDNLIGDPTPGAAACRTTPQKHPSSHRAKRLITMNSLLEDCRPVIMQSYKRHASAARTDASSTFAENATLEPKVENRSVLLLASFLIRGRRCDDGAQLPAQTKSYPDFDVEVAPSSIEEMKTDLYDQSTIYAEEGQLKVRAA